MVLITLRAADEVRSPSYGSFGCRRSAPQIRGLPRRIARQPQAKPEDIMIKCVRVDAEPRIDVEMDMPRVGVARKLPGTPRSRVARVKGSGGSAATALRGGAAHRRPRDISRRCQSARRVLSLGWPRADV